MAYPAPFHRLVIQGTIYGDIFNTTLAFVPLAPGVIPAVSQALVDSVGTAVAAWWPDAIGGTPAGISLSSSAKLTGVKLNRIGTDGRYEDVGTTEWIAPTPVAGSSNATPPAQLALVATLRCPDERGHAGKGRMYFPPQHSVAVLATDGRLTSAQALGIATGVRELIVTLNDVYETAGVNGVAGVASKVGSGRFQVITSVSVGRVVDTIRSRRNKLAEAPETVDL